MNFKNRVVATIVAGFAVAGPSVAASVTALHGPASAADRQLGEAYVGWIAKVFEVPMTPDVDAPLRDALTIMVNAHLDHLRILLPKWIAEERARGGSVLPPGDLSRAIHNRIVNELALWRIESPGADYDAVLIRAILRPGICNLPVRGSYLGELTTWFQAVPPADRPILLAGERALLEHWGTRREPLPPRPDPSLADDEASEIARLRSGKAVPDVAMPPFLANSVFKGEVVNSSTDAQCALHQWGLARALHRGDSARAALLSWRYAMMKTASDWSSPAPIEAAKRDAAAYPLVARQWAIAGWVDLRVVRDPQGHFASASIANRHIVVPGVADNPPVAFETLFDDASIAGAPLRFKSIDSRADGTASNAVTMRINWNLQ